MTPRRLGPYRLVHPVGGGGMGVVHLALDEGDRAVALKVLRPHLAADPQARARLAREADTLRLVRSPRVAEVLDTDPEAEPPYIVTQYVPAPPLDEHVAAVGALRGRDLARLGLGLGEALAAIHRAGVVHRDLKPGNVLVDDGDPVVIDFGIAQIADDVRLTSAGLVMGTPGYLSPEVLDGAPVSVVGDWWGWAATLLFAATGRPPFGTGPLEAVLGRVHAGTPDTAGVEEPFAALLTAALAPDPADRPTPRVLREALQGVGATALETGWDGGSVRGAALPEPVTTVLPATPPVPRSPAAATTAVTTAVPAAATRAVRAAAVAPAAPATTPLTAAPTRVVPAPPPAAPTRVVPVAPPTRSVEASPPTQVVARPVPVGPADGSTAPQQHPPLPPADGPAAPPGPPAPPRRTSRTGVLLLLLTALAAVAAVAPVWAVILLAGGSVVARTVDRASASWSRRRYAHGARASDPAVTALAVPGHLLAAALSTAVALVLPVLMGVSAAFLVGWALDPGAAAAPGSSLSIAAGALTGALTAWWGPGGTTLRRGTRQVVRVAGPLPHGPAVAAGVLALLVVAAVTVVAQNEGRPDWAPLPGPPLAAASGS